MTLTGLSVIFIHMNGLITLSISKYNYVILNQIFPTLIAISLKLIYSNRYDYIL
jgi:hypothetical protein